MTSVQELAAVEPHAPRPFRWTVPAYYEMGEMGLFQDIHVELIDGQILQQPAMPPASATTICLTNEKLREIFGEGYTIRPRMPLRISNVTEPEPCILVVRGSIEDFETEHPSTGVLLVEVSDSTLLYDRAVKSSLYACAGVTEYWILNMRTRRLETFRTPIADEDSRFGWCYGETRIYLENESLAPLKRPENFVAVTDLLA